MLSDNYFYLTVTGQLKHITFPLGPDGVGGIFCRYDVVYGSDWELVSGLRSGISQCAEPNPNRKELVTFNMPIEFTFRSTNPHGWPQIVFSVYGSNWWRCETSRGYAHVHIPLGTREIHAPITIPRCSNFWAAVISWFSGRNPELRDPKVLANGNKTKGLSTESYGNIVVAMQSISRGSSKLGLDWGQLS